MGQIEPSEAFKLYRQYLGLSQTELAMKMAVTSTSISRWETGSVELSTYSQPMLFIRTLVEKKLRADMSMCIQQIKPELTIGEFQALFGHPSAELHESRDKKMYVGLIQIDEHHDHTIQYSLTEQRWVAIGERGAIHELTPAFLKSLRHNTRPSWKTKAPRSK